MGHGARGEGAQVVAALEHGDEAGKATLGGHRLQAAGHRHEVRLDKVDARQRILADLEAQDETLQQLGIRIRLQTAALRELAQGGPQALGAAPHSAVA